MNSLVDGQPVERSEKRSDMSRARAFEDKPNSIILNFLKLVKQRERRASKKRVTVVEAR